MHEEQARLGQLVWQVERAAWQEAGEMFWKEQDEEAQHEQVEPAHCLGLSHWRLLHYFLLLA